MNKYNVKDGIYYLDIELSKLEFELFREFEDMLLKKGYKYLSLPSAGSWEVLDRQEVVTRNQSLGIDDRQALFGSAEQGFLEYFMDKEVNEEQCEKYFNELLNNSIDFLKKYNIEYRVIDKTKEDPGYHYKKYDIEVNTKKYGWMETHSCTYFKDEQTKRLGINGGLHTISNTGIASPRILIPFIEKMEEIDN